MNYQVDYYRALKISEHASIEEIKQAYKRESKRCHPDLGGSHSEMVLVNEAWEILSNPSKRNDYDQTRKSPQDKAAASRHETNKRNASREAQNYPRQWKNFEKYVDSLIQDIKDTSYTYTYQKLIGVYPTAENSDSGTIFIIAGSVLGIILLSPMFISSASTPKFFLISITIPAMIGAWLGMFLHQWIKKTIS